MCKLFVVNSLYLGNRSLGLELLDGKGVVEMTEKQVRDGLNSGKEIYGLRVAANGIDLDIDSEDFYMTNLVIHRHIGNYQPMFETENPVCILFIVTGMKEEKGSKVYELISSRFEKKEVSEDMLKSLFLMGAVCGGAKLDGDTIIMASERKKSEPEKVEAKQTEKKKEPAKENDAEPKQDKTGSKKDPATSEKKPVEKVSEKKKTEKK